MNAWTEQANELEAIKRRIVEISAAYLVMFTEKEELKKENRELEYRLRAQTERLAHSELMLEECNKLVTALRYDRNYYRDELARRNN